MQSVQTLKKHNNFPSTSFADLSTSLSAEYVPLRETSSAQYTHVFISRSASARDSSRKKNVSRMTRYAGKRARAIHRMPLESEDPFFLACKLP